MKKITYLLLTFLTFSVFGQNKLTSRVSEDFDGTNWLTTSKTEYSYDTNGNLITEKYFNNNNGGLGLQENYSYIYNSNNRVVEASGDNYKTVITYNANNLPSATIDYDKVNNSWVEDYKFEIFYNGTKLDYYISYDWNGQAWVLAEDESERITYTYTGSNFTTISYEDYADGTWVNGGKDELEYDSNNRLTKEEYYSYIDGTYNLDEFYGYTYDSNDNVVSVTGGYNNDSEIINNEPKTYQYDTTQLMSILTHPFKSKYGIVFYPETSDFFVNKILSETSGTDRTTYYYGNEPTASVSRFKTVDFSVYPNPTTSTIKIDDSNFSIKNVELYSVIGKKVMISNKNKLNLQHLVNGVYLLKIETKSGEIATKRIIKN